MSKSTSKKNAEYKIAADVLDELQVRTFQIDVAGKLCDAFLLKYKGEFVAYVNECKHLPVPLDLYAATIFNQSKTALQCHQHGAVYDFETGLCIEGPCKGASLTKLFIRKKGKHLVISSEQS